MLMSVDIRPSLSVIPDDLITGERKTHKSGRVVGFSLSFQASYPRCRRPRRCWHALPASILTVEAAATIVTPY